MSSNATTWGVATYHPAFLLRNQRMTIAVIRDLKKAARVHKTGPTRIPASERAEAGRALDWAIYPTVSHVEAFFAQWRGTRMSVDYESTMRGEPWCAAFWPCADEHQVLSTQGLCIPFRMQGGDPYWRGADQDRVLNIMFTFLRDASWPKVGQNWVGFDGGYHDRGWNENAHALIKRAWGVDVHGLDIDTMVAQHAVYAELPLGLAFQASMVSDLGPYKLEVHERGVDDDKADDSNKGFANISSIPDYKLRLYCLRDAFVAGLAACEHEVLMA